MAERFGHGLGRQTVSTSLNELAKHDLADGEEDRAHRGEKRWWSV